MSQARPPVGWHRVRKLDDELPVHAAVLAGAAVSSEADTTRRQHILDADPRLRIEELEHQANFGLCAFLVLGELLSNVRSNGGMASDVIENIFAELANHCRAGTPIGTHPMVKYIEAMWRGDTAS